MSFNIMNLLSDFTNGKGVERLLVGIDLLRKFVYEWLDEASGHSIDLNRLSTFCVIGFAQTKKTGRGLN